MLRQLLNIFLFFPSGFLSLTMNNAIGLVLFLAQLFISVICISTFHAHFKLIYSSMKNTGKVTNPHKKFLQAELEASCCSCTLQMPKPTIKGVKSDFRVQSDSYLYLS